MKLILENNNLDIIDIPNIPNGNYWISYESKNILNVESYNNNWIIKSYEDIKIYRNLLKNDLEDDKFLDEVILKEYDYYNILDYKTNTIYNLYVVPSYEKMQNFDFNLMKGYIFKIGKGQFNDCAINNELFAETQIELEKDDNNRIVIRNRNKSLKLFINNEYVKKDSFLNSGDLIFIGGFYFYYLGNIFSMSDYKNNIIFYNPNINVITASDNNVVDYSKVFDKDIKIYDKGDFFQRPPRFKRVIEKKVFQIDAPTHKENQEELPLIFTIAPMITMGMMSLVTGVTSLQKVLDGKSTLKEEFSSLLMCGCMMLAMIVFPLIQKFYTKFKKKKREKTRRKKYKQYINNKRKEIFTEIDYQKEVIIEDNLPMDKVRELILTKHRDLWERKLEHNDFLELRLGVGNRKPDIDIKYPMEHFTVDEDDLKDIIKELVGESKDIVNVPITLNFKENNKVGIIGNKELVRNILDVLMLQIMAYHGYDVLRLVILTNDNNKVYWEKFRNLTYLWNNDVSLRYYATNKDDINKVTGYLREELNYRLELSNNKDIMFNPYYLIITDDVNFVKNNVFIKDILKLKNKIGYSVLMCVDKLDELPNECSMFINLDKDMSNVFTNDMSENNQVFFKPDKINFSLNECISVICNIPMDINSGKFVLPRNYSFLEMYDVGNINQLNVINRWNNNNIIKSLSCPVGVDEQGEVFNVDLHEKAHGPHGLVAGMTGSGKSEWIITYILSMAINYSPEEVQFVLIDYKGGGLALTFDNQENGIKLPHVVGTITNLDNIEIKRSLASIESELKRRQAMFKNAREKLNESSMDIYKYQEYYRKGQLIEPMSHLFIISDEFAELKAQQPDFMDELISTARIGRSLGVHLILATQKPSGVVDAQIWSNSKFKVCLKVQDKSDSNDMIKMPDAAMIKETGRFYFQVGYNEFLAKGQCAYAGNPYYESDKRIVLIDSSVDFVDSMGGVIKKGNISKQNNQYVHKGEELPNILNHIIEVAETQKLKIKPLWLNRISSEIFVDKLKNKYNYKKENYILNPIVGEYDYPSKQKQDLLTVPISKDGNVILYGASSSGKELFITTMLYSLITTYTPNEVGIYILDFGTEILNNFKDSSHVGDIIHSDEDEKIDNLFKFIKTEIEFRRKKFVQYNGNYSDYILKSDDKVHNIVVIINSFDVFSELYNNYSEKLYELTRECNKFGIYFVITVNSISGVRSKLAQTFKGIYALQLNNEFDYRSLFGNTNGIVPSKMYGRGLVKKDIVLEFQTAYAFDKNELYKKILETSIMSYMKYKTKIKSIPILPNIVEFKHINKKKISFDFIPIGMVKKDLSVANLNLKDIFSFLISFRDFDSNINFIDNFLNILDSSNINTVVLDSRYIYDNNKFSNIKYLNSGYTGYINSLINFVNEIDTKLKLYNNNLRVIKDVEDILCVVIGIDKLFNSLSSEDKNKFIDVMTKAKESLKIHFVFIDIPSGFKGYEYDAWYKKCINSGLGLWVGDGFAEQYLIKPTKVIQGYYDVIGNNFGYLVINGQVKFIKIIEKM